MKGFYKLLPKTLRFCQLSLIINNVSETLLVKYSYECDATQTLLGPCVQLTNLGKIFVNNF